MSGMHGRARHAARVAVRATARVALGVVLVLVGFVSLLFVHFGPQDWVLVWLLAMFAVCFGVTMAWTALWPPKGDEDHAGTP